MIYVSPPHARDPRARRPRNVLRDGRHIRTLDAATSTDSELVELMTGRKIDLLFQTIRTSGQGPGRRREPHMADGSFAT